MLIGGAPVPLPDAGGDWTWNWNWNWDSGCAPGDLPTPMTIGGDGWSWDWNWTWTCAEDAAPQPTPAPAATPRQAVAPVSSRVATRSRGRSDGTHAPVRGRRAAVALEPDARAGRRGHPTSEPLAAPVPVRARTAVLAPASLSTVAGTHGKAHASAGALPGPDPAGEPPAPDPPSPAPPAASAGAAGAAGSGSLLLAALLAALALLAPGRGRRMRGHARAPRSPLDSRRPERPG